MRTRYGFAAGMLIGAALMFAQARNDAPETVAGIAVNYDEAKVGDYVLPDALTLNSGKPVRDAKTWWKKRRPEIVEMLSVLLQNRLAQVGRQTAIGGPTAQAMDDGAVAFELEPTLDASHLPLAESEQPSGFELRSLALKHRRHGLQKVPFLLRHCDPVRTFGALDAFVYPISRHVLRRGDMLFLFTDGVAEAQDASRALYTPSRLRHALAGAPTSSAQAAIEHSSFAPGLDVPGVSSVWEELLDTMAFVTNESGNVGRLHS